MIIKNPLYIVPPRGTYVQDTTATPADVLYPKEFYQADGQKVQGTIPTYAGAVTVTPSDAAQTLGTQGEYVESDIVVNPIPSDYGMVAKDVNFYDYDGKIVKSYTAAEFADLTALPSNPTHTGLVAEGWNWTLADAKTYVASYGKLDIGQVYHTASGKTEFDIVIDDGTGYTATLGLSGTEKDWGDGTVDTNTSHTYAAAGNYTIKLSGTTLPSITGSKKVRAIRIASGVTSIGNYAFQNCYALQSATISSSVTSVGTYAFSNCYSLQSATIPSSVTSVGTYAFYSCSALQSVTIPSSVTSIGSNTFGGCYSLQSATIPSSVTSIGASAFYSCSALQFVIIPSSVTSIGNNAFRGCNSLQSVTIPSSVTSIGNNAFGDCSWLTIATVLATTPTTLANSNAFPSTVTKIYIPAGTLNDYLAEANWSDYYNSDPTLNRLWELNGVISGVLNVNRGRATLSQGVLEVN